MHTIKAPIDACEGDCGLLYPHFLYPRFPRRLQTAQQLVQQLLQHANPAASTAAAASGGQAAPTAAAAAPFPVLVHYAKVLVETLQGLLLKPPQGATQAGESHNVLPQTSAAA